MAPVKINISYENMFHLEGHVKWNIKLVICNGVTRRWHLGTFFGRNHLCSAGMNVVLSFLYKREPKVGVWQNSIFEAYSSNFVTKLWFLNEKSIEIVLIWDLQITLLDSGAILVNRAGGLVMATLLQQMYAIKLMLGTYSAIDAF